LAAGVPIKAVQAQLGHASAQVTLDLYGHFMPDTGAPGAAAFEVLLGGGGNKVPVEPPQAGVAETVTHAYKGALEGSGTVSDAVIELVPQPGFELGTHALRMRCSTN
jgi:hypothetical protein